jgi:hypothetical protein
VHIKNRKEAKGRRRCERQPPDLDGRSAQPGIFAKFDTGDAMTLDQAKEFYQKIRDLKKRYSVCFSDYHEEERDGEIKFVNVTLRMKIDKKVAPVKNHAKNLT